MMANRMGFRFRPSNEELVDHYLRKKIDNRNFSVPRIKDLGISKIEPRDLPQRFPDQLKDRMWYFYCLHSQYGNSKNTSRKTSAGSWKITAKDKVIKALSGSRKVIGVKKTLTFYERHKDSEGGKRAKTKSIKTNWVMDEFHYHDIPHGKMPYVICRIKIKQDDKDKLTNKDSSSQHLASNVRSEVSTNLVVELGPPLISQSEIFNEVMGTVDDFASVDQSLIHPQQESFDDLHTNTSSPDEGQLSDHQLASNNEDDGWECPVLEMDPCQLVQPNSPFHLPQSSVDKHPCSCDKGQQDNNLPSDYGYPAIEKVDPRKHDLSEAYDGGNGSSHNYLITQELPILLESEPPCTQGLIEVEDDFANALWALENRNFWQEPIGTVFPDINSLYYTDGLHVGDYCGTDTEITNLWV